MNEDIHAQPSAVWGWPQDTGPLPILRELRGMRAEEAGEWRSFLMDSCYRDTPEGRVYMCGHDWISDDVFADLAVLSERGYKITIEGDPAPSSFIQEPLVILIEKKRTN